MDKITIPEHAPIFILGYMASGKTTFGRALAKQLGREFIDLDFYIEQRFHQSVSQIFSTRGEAEFRRLESLMLREAGEFEDVVISCGGGTPCFDSNMDFMLERGLTVWLNASQDCIVRRLSICNSRRPLMAGKSVEQLKTDVAAGLARRHPHYSRAHITFPGENLEDRRQIQESVVRFLSRF